MPTKIMIAMISMMIGVFLLGISLGIYIEGTNTMDDVPMEENTPTEDEFAPEDNEDEVTPEDVFIGDINLDVIAGHLNLEGNESVSGEIVNAIDGRTYLDNAIDIYQFDVDSFEYQNAVAFGTVLMYQTIEVNVSACNGGYILIIYDSYEGNRDELIEKFMSIKM